MKKIEFVKAAYNIKELPKNDLPIAILVGRSNVGKSSFINCLFHPKRVAKTSSTPGKTRSINYYLVENKFYLVDLPGFGYAKVSKSERDQWQSLIEKFIDSSRNIILAFHLIDSRHDPTPLDLQLYHYLVSKGIIYNAVLNKVDKLNQSEIALCKKRILSSIPDLKVGENLFLFSAVSGFGKREIIQKISNTVL